MLKAERCSDEFWKVQLLGKLFWEDPIEGQIDLGNLGNISAFGREYDYETYRLEIDVELR